MRKHSWGIFIVFFVFQSGLFAQEPDYKIATLPTEKRVEDLLKRMTLEEKVAQLQTSNSLTDPSKVPQNGLGCLTEVFCGFKPKVAAQKYNELQKAFLEKTRLGIPVLYHGEAVTGLMATGTTAFPQPLAQAATFNLDLHTRMAEAISTEVLSWGHKQVLSPTINVAYDSRWGRTHETYGEDPYLVSQMGLTYIKALESAGILTTPKHFAANIGHNGHFSDAVYFSERFLREVEFPPFKTAVMEGKCSSLMPAYNSLNGIPCTSNKWLLTDILRNEWGFTGFVGSDYGAVGELLRRHKTVETAMDAAIEAFEAGCNVEMPQAFAFPYLVEAVKTGRISEQKIDESVRILLTNKFKLGLFDKPYVDPDWAEKICDSNEHRALALEMSKESIVLLKNEKSTLPFSKDIKSIAVLGPLADKQLLGNYAPWGTKVVSILEGIKNKVGKNIQLNIEKGVELSNLSLPIISNDYLSCIENGKEVKGLKAEYFNNITLKGDPIVSRVDDKIDFEWGEGVPHPFLAADSFSVRWTGRLISPVTGKYKIGMTCDDGARIYLDDKLIIDSWKGRSERLVEFLYEFEKNKSYNIKVEYFEGNNKATARLGWTVLPYADIPKAVAAAQNSDAILIVCGVTDGEGKDRADLDLTPGQEELISEVASLGKPYVIILASGNVISMQDWEYKAPAILEVWYPGEEGGTAVADVLFGDYNPGGKLPITFPRVTGQVPCFYHKPLLTAGTSYIGIGNSPLFPFGHGLSYTTFDYSALEISSEKIGSSESINVSMTITNSGKVKGDEVVQLYIKDIVGSVVRPEKLLRRFQRISLNPGESKSLKFTINPEDFSMWNRNMKWVVEPGKFEIQLGSSSADIRLKKGFEVVQK
jgi:beta-glucosidase